MRERQRLGDEEVEIFEIAENAEIERDAQRKHGFASGPIAFDIESDQIADRAAGEQQQQKAPVPGGVEGEAQRQQHPLLQQVPGIEAPDEGKRESEKKRKINCWKQHESRAAVLRSAESGNPRIGPRSVYSRRGSCARNRAP